MLVLLLPKPPKPVEVLLLLLEPKPLPPLPNPPKPDMMGGAVYGSGVLGQVDVRDRRDDDEKIASDAWVKV